MGKKNSYAQVLNDRVELYIRATKETYVQFMIDMFSIVLNDPDVMGKGVLGRKRLKKVIDAVGERYDYYHNALEKTLNQTIIKASLMKG